MRARDQSSIFSTGGKFCPDYGLLLEFHTLTLVARSYVLLALSIEKFDLVIVVTVVCACKWSHLHHANQCTHLKSIS